jgi:organic radical activating enzyme
MENEFFSDKIFSIFSVYSKNKVYFDSSCIVCTTICNLNCKDCLNFTPYNKGKKHIPIDALIRDVDLYFACVDRVDLFHITGGEPLLYPHLIKLLDHLGNNYSEKINLLGTTINGSIVPSDELCEAFKKYNVKIYIDDYRMSVPQLNETFVQTVEKLKKYTQVETWIRTEFFLLFPPKQNMNNASDEVLEKKFNDCANPFMELKGGKVYNCNWSEFAMTAGVFSETENDSFDLASFTPDKKKQLVEYRLGYSNKGYSDFCKYCNGSWNINETKVPAARQAKGLIVWDINNPTEIKGD